MQSHPNNIDRKVISQRLFTRTGSAHNKKNNTTEKAQLKNSFEAAAKPSGQTHEQYILTNVKRTHAHPHK